jgi:hypothetical protein
VTEQHTPYPVRVDAAVDRPLSRWLWLVKWLLLVPHAIVPAFLWFAFVVLTVIAWFAILVTGRYPRSLFDVGVLRWGPAGAASGHADAADGAGAGQPDRHPHPRDRALTGRPAG